MRTPHAYSVVMLLVLAGTGLIQRAVAQDLPAVQVAVEKNEVYVGEPFVFQIQVDNVDQAEAPDLAAVASDFTVDFAGGNVDRRQSISIVNGRTTRVDSRKYLMNYRLIAKRPGELIIPPLTLNIGGRTFTTKALTVRAFPPEPVEGFKLVSRLSKDTCYVGEPVELTTVLYVGQQIVSMAVSMPALTAASIYSEPIALPKQPGLDYYTIPVNDTEVEAEKNGETLDGRQYVTLTFRHIVVPKETGSLSLPETNVSLETPSGARRRSRSMFDQFPIFGQDTYKQVIVPGNALTLNVKAVPEAGKPAGFSGLIGRYTLSASASPTQVNVGDPITLTLVLEGSQYLNQFEFPPLQQQEALAADFRIPEEMAPGRMEGDHKVFTQTIRAESENVNAIPAISVSYFDTETGAYATTASEPIPIHVQATQVVTASDAEGYQRPVETVEHVAVDAGIAHNFTEADCLRPQRFGPDVWMRTAGSWLLLLLPPGCFGLLASFQIFRRLGGGRSELRNRRQAGARLEAALDGVGPEDDVYSLALEALRVFLGAKLSLNPSALTFADVRGPLLKRAVSEERLEALEAIFRTCEAHRYAGGAGTPGATADFLGAVRECVRGLDKEIGR